MSIASRTGLGPSVLLSARNMRTFLRALTADMGSGTDVPDPIDDTTTGLTMSAERGSYIPASTCFKVKV
jgi:hypothetical protein